jgi:glycosyltransferase involved in cell wall biosynthesis
MRVVAVDATAPLPRISNERADGGRFVSAWIVVRRDGIPCGTLELDFGPDGVIDPVELRAMVAQVPAPSPRPDAECLPSMSVVVATNLARPDGLRRTLASLAAVDYPDLEVIVVDNRAHGGGDPLPAIVAVHPDVVVVTEPQPGCFAASNAGVAVARGEIVAFTDDDVEVDPLWARALGRRFATHPEEDAVTGLILPAELETAAQVWFERYYGGFAAARRFEPLSFASAVSAAGRREPWRVVATDSRSRIVRSFPVYGAGAIGAGANMAFRAEALDRLGGFDASLASGMPARGGGDLAAFMTLLWEGGRMGFEPAAVVHHQHRLALAELRRQVHGYGIGYMAVLLSLIRRDHRHATGIARQVPAALGRYARNGRGQARPAHPAGVGRGRAGYPRYLRIAELSGNLRGPSRYAVSVRKARRWAG